MHEFPPNWKGEGKAKARQEFLRLSLKGKWNHRFHRWARIFKELQDMQCSSAG
jgi:hypothetical protein